MHLSGFILNIFYNMGVSVRVRGRIDDLGLGLGFRV